MRNQKLSVVQRLTMPLPELELYYREQRKYRFERGKKLNHIQLRKAFYPLFSGFLALDRIFRKQSVTVMGRRRNYDGPVIYACTHIAENDLENIYEALHQGCWWFVGDPCVLYKEISGLFVHLNGCIMLELNDAEDRHIAYLRAVELLTAGGSLMIFPEGARNGSEYLPVMPLFFGTAKMAMETNTKIVPVAIEQYERRFIINFGNEICPEDFGTHTDLTQRLRDALATLKWEIWEREGLRSRDGLPENCRELFQKEFETRIHPYDTLETVERSRYHTKEETEQKDAFVHLKRLIPCRENAFLLRTGHTVKGVSQYAPDNRS